MTKTSKTTVKARGKPAKREHEPRRAPRARAAPMPALRQKAAAATLRVAGGKPGPEPAAVVTTLAFYANPTLSLVCRPADAPVLFSLGTAADLTGVHPGMLRYYLRVGLLGTVQSDGDREPWFDEEALQEVRRIEHYRRHLAVSRRALPLVCELRREADRQHIAIQFLQCP